MSTQNEPQLFDVPAVLIEARYRERVLCARLLPARSGPGFTVGSGRRADAPIDPSFLPPHLPANDNHTLVTPSAAGFFVNLSPAMVARCERTATRLRIPCGEVIFDISAAAPAPVVPRSWLGAGWPLRRDACRAPSRSVSCCCSCSCAPCRTIRTRCPSTTSAATFGSARSA